MIGLGEGGSETERCDSIYDNLYRGGSNFLLSYFAAHPVDVKTGEKELFLSLRCMYVIVFGLVHSCK